MGMYKYIKEAWKNKDLLKQKMIQWRKEPVTTRIERPTRLDRARALGYKPKQGIILVRQRVVRGGRKRPNDMGGRRPKHARRRKVLDINYQTVCEQRAAKSYPNCEVLNSYYVGKDGKHFWYEVILVERSHPNIKKDKNLRWVAESHHKGRAFRGKTSSARKSRGLRRKGLGAEKAR
ncbi:50S ribosomal protein L15e [Candidatus Woesearchaeota archaeon]|nr:50S ribosomal protein L15e [Candidatus Woesearchaeota archaeon]